ncbi:MAG: hypothetical protein WCK20_01440 [Thermoleophilia bacterium]
MDNLVAISQSFGLAVACGLAAVLPLGVLAVAALLGWRPGSVAIAAESPALIVGWVLGVVEAAGRAFLPIPVRIGLSGLGGAVACELTLGHLIPFVGLLLGSAIGAGTAWTTTRLVDRAVASGGPRWGVTALVGGASIVVAALAIIPAVGLILVGIVIWVGMRSRKDDQGRYAGLRVLR